MPEHIEQKPTTVEEHRIHGDCLEGIGIPNGGIAVIAIGEIPNVFDVVWCEGSVGGELGGYLKQIVQTGANPIVRTRYKDGKRNYMFRPCSVFGVVLKVLDYDRNVVWERPSASNVIEVVRCKDCKHWHEETGWCYHHSHFVKSDGGFCHPWESADWKMFDADYWCADGERREQDA